MAEITYKLNEELPEEIPGFEQYQDQDLELLDSFQINNLFDPTKNFSELHILDLADTLLSSAYYYTGYKLSLNAQSAGKEGASVLTIDPIQDALSYGYSFGGIKLLYHFLNDLYTSDSTTLDFYIDSISPDRTELQLLTNNLTAEDVVRYTEAVKTNLKSQSYFSEFRLNFKDNNLLIGLNLDNLDTVNGKAVVVKLYEPLPDTFNIKSKLSIVEIISDSIAYELDYEETLDTPTFPTLRSANFNLDLQDENVIPTQYFNYDELLSYKVGNTNSEVYSMMSEKGVELSIDYSDYSKFIHFSSAQERLLNFKYKIDLLASYSQSLATKGSATGGSSGVSGSVAYYEGLYQGIINNFDHYERFLYYESGSNSWPKTNSVKPYTNQASSLATTWYNSALTAAVAYDSTNYNSLVETIPTYLKDDPANDNYLTFVYMVGQHFDNLWVYGDAVTDKYDNDNRLNYGISKDLVGEALKNFGVKLYTSNKSIEDLFSTFIGQGYQSGSEIINNYITGFIPGIPITSGISPSSVVIGNQIWATQNLDVSTYSDGTLIPQVTDSTEWTNATSGAWCYYGNNSSSGSVYGKLYNWYAVAGIHNLASLTDVGQRKELAPSGYRIPSNTDWNTLITTLGGSGVAGGAIRETGTAHWLSTNSTATNSSGFTGLGGSDRGQTGTFDIIKLRGYWWSSTLESETAATAFYTQYTDSGIYNEGSGFRYGFSVRCLEDGVPTTPDTPIQPTSFDNYQKEIQKRIYHNLPLLLKSKGTERGLRALINCFGIPSDVLDIKLYGGKNTYKLPLFGDSQYVTSSLDKIRLDNTGSLVSGNTLSNYTSIVKRDDKYTDDIHVIEVGFSPTDNVDNYIISRSAATFSIDDYLGDPRNLYSDNYSGLYRTASTLLSSSLGTSGSYDLRDYVRLIKFFDNTIFKMVKDFIPARSIADTGIIIKPNILNISKAKSVILEGDTPEYEASIPTYKISANSINTFSINGQLRTTGYQDYIQIPTNKVYISTHLQEEPRYNGELLGSYINVAGTDLNKDNPYKQIDSTSNSYDIVFVSSSNVVCNLQNNSQERVYINPSKVYTPADFFSYTDPRTSYSASLTVSPTNYYSIDLNNGYMFTEGLTQYQDLLITANDFDYVLGSCTATVNARYGICELVPSVLSSANVIQYSSNNQETYDLRGTGYFRSYRDQTNLEYTASWNDGGTSYVVGIATPSSYKYTQPLNTEVTITVKDPRLGDSCQASQIVIVNNCELGSLDQYNSGILMPDREYSFEYSTVSVEYGYNNYNFAYLGGPSMQKFKYNFNPSDYNYTYLQGNVGIQYFFTPNTSTYIYNNLNIQYNIYELTYNNTTNTYNVRSIGKDLTPEQESYSESYKPICEIINIDVPAPPLGAYDCENYAQNVDRSRYEYPILPLTLQTPLLNTYVPEVREVTDLPRPAQGTVIDNFTYEYSTAIFDFNSRRIIAGTRSYLQWIENAGGGSYFASPTACSGPTPYQRTPDNGTWSYTSIRIVESAKVITKPPHTLPQAYIVEATTKGFATCSSQVIIYGENSIIKSVEGDRTRAGVSVKFEPPKNSSSPIPGIGGWLLVGYDYSTNLKPAVDYPTIPPAYTGPWVFVKVRRFS